MKKIYIILVATLLLSSPTLAQDASKGVRFENILFKIENGNTYITFDLNVQPNSIANCQGLLIVPELSGENKSLQLPYILINGANRRRAYTRWLTFRDKKPVYPSPVILAEVSKLGAPLEYDVQIPYMEWMSNAKLMVSQELCGCGDRVGLPKSVLADVPERYIEEPIELVPQPNPAITEAPIAQPVPQRIEISKQVSAFLNFEKAKSDIAFDYGSNPKELAKISDAIDEIKADPSLQIVGITITGYASPDGRYAANERLSAQRAAALKRYILLYSNLNLSESQIEVTSVAEDWEGLHMLVQQSTIHYKDELLSIINSTISPDAREAKLKLVGKGIPYRIMMADMFPKLRRIELDIKTHQNAEP